MKNLLFIPAVALAFTYLAEGHSSKLSINQGIKSDNSLTSIYRIDITPEKIFENYIKAIGGKENIKKIKDVTTKLSAVIQGQKIDVLQLIKMPNLFKTAMSIEGMGDVMVQAFDGKKGTIVQMGQKQDIDGGMLEASKFQSDIFSELKYKENGVKYSLKGTEKINGKDAYKIDLSLSDTTIKVSDFYDVETGLKVRRSLFIAGAPQGANSQVSDYSNYKEINGVKFPYTISSSILGQTFILQVQSIEVNKSIADDLFIIK